MKTYRFDDKLQVPSSRKIQDTGQMIAEGAIARVGVLTYKASDLGDMFNDKEPDAPVRVAQLSDDLFAESTLDKFRSAPITIGHPLQDVDTTNMKELGKGTLEGKPYQDGTHLSASMVLSDQEAIDLVNSGVHELSVRAYYTLTRCDDAEDYDAIRTIQSVNHVAIVERGRAGITCRISDDAEGEVAIEPEMVADVQEVVTEEPVEAPVSDSEETSVEEAPDVLETLQQSLSDALERIKALEEKQVKMLEDAAEEEAGITPIARVIKEASLSDAQPQAPVKSEAELARERMIARNSHI